MFAVAENIEHMIQQDPGGRQVGQWANKGDILPAAESLLLAKHIVITTGFYIKNARAIETDGPPGALVLAQALTRLEKEVTLLVDDHAHEIIEAGARSLACDIQIIAQPTARKTLPREIFKNNTTHFIAIERPGKAKNGRYYNHRGNDISLFVAPFDDIFVQAQAEGIVTIGIGDGGNELGLCKVAPYVDQHVPNGRLISCQTLADYCISTGVSNWGGYGLVALLSLMTEKQLLPHTQRMKQLLKAIVDKGAVDGVTGNPTITVDGLDPSWEQDILLGLQKIVDSHVTRSK